MSLRDEPHDVRRGDRVRLQLAHDAVETRRAEDPGGRRDLEEQVGQGPRPEQPDGLVERANRLRPTVKGRLRQAQDRGGEHRLGVEDLMDGPQVGVVRAGQLDQPDRRRGQQGRLVGGTGRRSQLGHEVAERPHLGLGAVLEPVD